MKFKIRFADQIVGTCVVIALLALVFVIFMLGKSQRWFAHDLKYVASFDSAAGLSANMAVQYKGFTIGNLKSFELVKGPRPQDDKVAAVFTIQSDYEEWVREGSLVELSVSPIGLGNQFKFYPGLGEALIPEGDEIYTVGSPEGKSFIEQQIAYVPGQNDSINLIITQVNTTLQEVNTLLATVNTATIGSSDGKPDGTTELGRILGTVGSTLASVDTALKGKPNGRSDRSTEVGRILGDVRQTIAGVQALPGTIDTVIGQIRPILDNVNTIVAKVSSQDGLVAAALDKSALESFDTSLRSVSGILRNVEKTSDILPAQAPQLVRIIAEVEGTLKQVNDVLTGLKNNPLLKNGIPAQVNTQATGLNPRNVSF